MKTKQLSLFEEEEKKSKTVEVPTDRINKELSLKIGVGGIVNGELITFDFRAKDKLKPYLCIIDGRDFQYGFKREFVDKKYVNDFIIKPYGKEMSAIVFSLQPFVVYEYKRFAGTTLGEICEGYFVVVSDRIVELEYEEVRHWCGTAKEKANAKSKGRTIFGGPDKKYAPDDVDF